MDNSITVTPNPRIFKALKTALDDGWTELKRISAGTQPSDSLFHRQRRTELFQRALFLPAVTRDMDVLLWILRRLRDGNLLRFLRRVKHAELLIPVVKEVCPFLAALYELGALQIQDDLPESLVFFAFPAILFSERINGALQHGQLLLDCKKYFRLFHAAFTTLHV